MFGTVIGDIAGSRFEFGRKKAEEDFDLFDPAKCRFTDDTVLTAAVCDAFLQTGNPVDYDELRGNVRRFLQRYTIRYPFAGYGQRFWTWVDQFELMPYNSYGNGAAMRVSPAAWAGRTEEEVFTYSDLCTGVTHSHPEALKGARAVALAVYLARRHAGKEEIRQSIRQQYYPLDFTLDEIRETYHPNATCQGTVPQAIEAFLEADSFESAVRNAVRIGGDTDTLAAMTGAIAEAYYGIPQSLKNRAVPFLNAELLTVFNAFEEKYQV